MRLIIKRKIDKENRNTKETKTIYILKPKLEQRKTLNQRLITIRQLLTVKDFHPSIYKKNNSIQCDVHLYNYF